MSGPAEAGGRGSAPPPLSLVVFDLDGTLVDSREDLAAAANATLHASGLAPLEVDAVAAMVGEGVRTLLDRAFAARGAVPPPEAVERFLEVYDRRLIERTRPYAGVRETLAALEGRVAMAVLTNKPTAPARQILEGLGLAPVFAAVVGGDGPFPRKPAPDGLLGLARQAAVPPAAVLMVGDSWIDAETALNAGTRFCLARYGFGFSPSHAARLPPGAIQIDRPEDLVPHVLGSGAGVIGSPRGLPRGDD
jgi:phosphoglycolate phosphatase